MDGAAGAERLCLSLPQWDKQARKNLATTILAGNDQCFLARSVV
jgi:hypothetical protein